MLRALRRIYKEYDTSSNIIKWSDHNWWLSWEEWLEMSYDNIQQEAKMASHWIREMK